MDPENHKINPNLLLTALNYHGQELFRALQLDHGDKILNLVDNRHLDYVEYHKRALQAELPLRSKKVRLLQFIAKKADKLFQFATSPKEPADQSEEMFAVLPPIEKYMIVPPVERRRRFFEGLKCGDIVIGLVKSRNHQMPGRASCVLQLLCVHGRLKRYIEDLCIKADVQHCDYSVGTLVRGYVANHSSATSKIIVAMSPDYSQKLKLTNLGVITPEDLPQYFRFYNTSDSYSDILEKIPSFSNPSAVPNLCNVFGLPLSGRYNSFTEKLNTNFPRAEYASELEKKQMSHWAMRSVREGTKYGKEENITDAFQCLNNALVIDPHNTEAFVERGVLYAGMENFEKAISDFKYALSIDAENRNAKKYLSDAYMMLGQKYAGDGNVDKSYENFKYAVEYNSSNKEAFAYLTAIISVKSIEDAEKEHEGKSDCVEQDYNEKEVEVSTEKCITSTEQSLESAETVWPSSYSAPWPNSSYIGQQSAWQGSSAWSGETPSTWTSLPPHGGYSVLTPDLSTHSPAASSVLPSPVGAPIPSISRRVPVKPGNHQEPQYEKRSETLLIEDQIKKFIEEEREKHAKRAPSPSNSSSSSSSRSRKKTKRSGHKNKKHNEKGNYSADDSSPSSAVSHVDVHKLKCEEFLERNRRQMEKVQTLSRDSRGHSSHLSKKDVKDTSKKDCHHKYDRTHKKECAKKLSRVCGKDHDKASRKDSPSAKKDAKQEVLISKTEEKVVKSEQKKSEETKVETIEIGEIDSDMEIEEINSDDDRTDNTPKELLKAKASLKVQQVETLQEKISKESENVLSSTQNIVLVVRCTIPQGEKADKIQTCKEPTKAVISKEDLVNADDYNLAPVPSGPSVQLLPDPGASSSSNVIKPSTKHTKGENVKRRHEAAVSSVSSDTSSVERKSKRMSKHHRKHSSHYSKDRGSALDEYVIHRIVKVVKHKEGKTISYEKARDAYVEGLQTVSSRFFERCIDGFLRYVKKL